MNNPTEERKVTTKTLQEKFEEAFLDGRSRENVMVSSQLHLGADGEYFNPNTRALFNFFKKGAASVVVDLDPCDTEAYDCSGNLDFTRTVAAIEAAGGTVKP